LSKSEKKSSFELEDLSKLNKTLQDTNKIFNNSFIIDNSVINDLKKIERSLTKINKLSESIKKGNHGFNTGLYKINIKYTSANKELDKIKYYTKEINNNKSSIKKLNANIIKETSSYETKFSNRKNNDKKETIIVKEYNYEEDRLDNKRSNSKDPRNDIKLSPLNDKFTLDNIGMVGAYKNVKKMLKLAASLDEKEFLTNSYNSIAKKIEKITNRNPSDKDKRKDSDELSLGEKLMFKIGKPVFNFIKNKIGKKRNEKKDTKNKDTKNIESKQTESKNKKSEKPQEKNKSSSSESSNKSGGLKGKIGNIKDKAVNAIKNNVVWTVANVVLAKGVNTAHDFSRRKDMAAADTQYKINILNDDFEFLRKNKGKLKLNIETLEKLKNKKNKTKEEKELQKKIELDFVKFDTEYRGTSNKGVNNITTKDVGRDYYNSIFKDEAKKKQEFISLQRLKSDQLTEKINRPKSMTERKTNRQELERASLSQEADLIKKFYDEDMASTMKSIDKYRNKFKSAFNGSKIKGNLYEKQVDSLVKAEELREKQQKKYKNNLYDLDGISTEIGKGLFEDIKSGTNYKNIKDENIQQSFNNLQKPLYFSNFANFDTERLKKSEKALNQLLDAANKGDTDLGKLYNRLVNLNSEFTKTKDIKNYEKSINNLAKQYSEESGADKNVLKDMFYRPDKDGILAGAPLDNLLSKFDKTRVDLSFGDKIAVAIEKQYLAVDNVLKNSKVSYDQEKDARTLDKIKLNKEMPEQLRKVISSLQNNSNASSVLEFTQEVLLDINMGKFNAKEIQSKLNNRFGKNVYVIDPELELNNELIELRTKELMKYAQSKYGEMELPINLKTVIKANPAASKEDIDNLLNIKDRFSDSIVNILKSEGETKGGKKVLELSNSFNKIDDKEFKNVITKDKSIGLEDSVKMAKVYKKFPKEVKTFFVTEGNHKYLKDVKDAYDVIKNIPREKKTEFEANMKKSDLGKTMLAVNEATNDKKVKIGLQDAITKKDVSGIFNLLDKVPKEKRSKVILTVNDEKLSKAIVDLEKLDISKDLKVRIAEGIKERSTIQTGYALYDIENSEKARAAAKIANNAFGNSSEDIKKLAADPIDIGKIITNLFTPFTDSITNKKQTNDDKLAKESKQDPASNKSDSKEKLGFFASIKEGISKATNPYKSVSEVKVANKSNDLNGIFSKKQQVGLGVNLYNPKTNNFNGENPLTKVAKDIFNGVKNVVTRKNDPLKTKDQITKSKKEDKNKNLEKYNKSKIKPKTAEVNTKKASKNVSNLSKNLKKLKNKTIEIKTKFTNILKNKTTKKKTTSKKKNVKSSSRAGFNILDNQETNDTMQRAMANYGALASYGAEDTYIPTTSTGFTLFSDAERDGAKIGNKLGKGLLGAFKNKIANDGDSLAGYFKFDIDFTREIDAEMSRVSNDVSLIDKKMVYASDDEKIKYLEEQNKLYAEQKALVEEKIKNEGHLDRQRNWLKENLKNSGFQFDENGKMTNYEEYLLERAKKLQSLEEKANKKNVKQKDIDAYNKEAKKFEELQKMAEQYFQVEYDNIPKLKEEWQELQNQIIAKENQVKEIQAARWKVSWDANWVSADKHVTEVNNEIAMVDVLLENAVGEEKGILIKRKIELLFDRKKEMGDTDKLLDDALINAKEEAEKYKFKIENGNIVNYREKLDFYKDNKSSEEFEKAKKAADEYLDLYINRIPEAKRNQAELNNQIKNAYKQQLEITKSVEDEITKIYEKEVEERKKLIDKELKANVDALKKKKEAYNDERKEANYQKNYDKQLEEVNKIQKQLDIAQRDTSLSGQKKVKDLLEKLKEEQEKLQDIVQDKIDDDVNQKYDKEIERLEEEAEKEKENLDEKYSKENIQNWVKEALNTGMFTDIDGRVTNLKDKMLEFTDKWGEGLGATGEIIKGELISNLEIARDIMKDIMKDDSKILNEIGKTNGYFYESIISPEMKNIYDNLKEAGYKLDNIFKVEYNAPVVNIEGNADNDILPEIEKMLKRSQNQLANEIFKQTGY
jgi:hypothetical protein